MVIAMDAQERKARHAKDSAFAYEVTLAGHSVRTEATQAPAPTPHTSTLTDAEELRWKNWIDDRIVAGIDAYHEGKSMHPVTREVIRGLVAELRKEIAAPIAVDILDTEMAKGSPHWLDPIEQYKGTHDAKRRQAQIEHANALQRRQRAEKAARRDHGITELPQFLERRHA